jgi:hypothetical protein
VALINLGIVGVQRAQGVVAAGALR